MRPHEKEIGLWKQFQKAKHTLKHFQPTHQPFPRGIRSGCSRGKGWLACWSSSPPRESTQGFAIAISSLQHPQKSLCRVPPQHCKGWTSSGCCISAHWMVWLIQRNLFCHSQQLSLPLSFCIYQDRKGEAFPRPSTRLGKGTGRCCLLCVQLHKIDQSPQPECQCLWVGTIWPNVRLVSFLPGNRMHFSTPC